MNKPSDFKWVSQCLFEKNDEVHNINMSINFESGLQDFDTHVSYTTPRVSFKFKNLNTGGKIDVEFGYTELYYLVKKSEDIIGKHETLDIKTLTKNKVRHLKISVSKNNSNQIFYKINAEDNTTVARIISLSMNKVEILSMFELLRSVLSNFAILGNSSFNVLNQQKIISELKKYKSNTPQVLLKSTLANVKKVSTITEEKHFEPEPDLEPEPEIEQEEEETLTEIEDDESEMSDEVPFDFVDPNEDKDNDTKSSVSDGFIINNDVLSDVELDGKKTNYNEKKTVTLTPRPFINVFMDWDIKQLFNWVAGFAYCDSSSNDLTLSPLELILLKSIGKDSYEQIKSQEKYYSFQYHILKTLKDGVNNYLTNEEFPTAPVLVFDKTVDNISKYTNKELWNFTADITLVFIILRLFETRLKDLKIKETTGNNVYSIKKSAFFLSTFVISFLQKIDAKDMAVFKDEITDVWNIVQHKDFIKDIENSFSDVTKGGKVSIDLQSIINLLDKYIEATSKLDYNSRNINNLPYNIESVEDIRKLISPSVSNESETVEDTQLKLFNKMMKSFKIESVDVSKLTKFSELQDLVSTYNDDQVVEIYNVIKNNPTITKISEVKRILNNSTTTTNEVEEKVEDITPSTKIDMSKAIDLNDATHDIFSVPDDDDYESLVVSVLTSGVN